MATDTISIVIAFIALLVSSLALIEAGRPSLTVNTVLPTRPGEYRAP
jgi:hypothetical protein